MKSIYKTLSYLGLFILSLALPLTSLAETPQPGYETREIALESGESISINQFGSQASGPRILWIPSEYGVRKESHFMLMQEIAKQGSEVWLADLHESYFMPPGRSSLTKVPLEDMAQLISTSLPDDKRPLYIVSSGRGAVLSLLSINKWLATGGNSERLSGVVLLHPNLQAGTPAEGEAMQYLPVTDQVQLPIYILQPDKSSKLYYLRDLVDRLSAGGSQVYTQIVKGVGDGFQSRLNSSDKEKHQAAELPVTLMKAMKLLADSKVDVDIDKIRSITDYSWEMTTLPDTLQPYPGNVAAPKLELKDINDKPYSLEKLKGKVVVINFWATWCPPCVKEIPSLGRLQKAFSLRDLEVISVDIGESKEDIEKFLEKVPAEFPVLIDPDGQNVKAWKIRAFPTTFVVDREGIIRLAYFGGLEWDDEAVVEQLRKLTHK